jgi:hypothetical protein
LNAAWKQYESEQHLPGASRLRDNACDKLTANTSTPPPTSPISSIARISPRSINWLLRLRPESLAWTSREAEPEADETAAKPWDI